VGGSLQKLSSARPRWLVLDNVRKLIGIHRARYCSPAPRRSRPT
jgi:hypothetical protein